MLRSVLAVIVGFVVINVLTTRGSATNWSNRPGNLMAIWVANLPAVPDGLYLIWPMERLFAAVGGYRYCLDRAACRN